MKGSRGRTWRTSWHGGNDELRSSRRRRLLRRHRFPNQRKVDLRERERLGRENVALVVDTEVSPTTIDELEHLHSPANRIRNPRIRHVMSRIDRQFFSAVVDSIARRECFAHPIGSDGKNVSLGDRRHTLASPAGNVGNDSVGAEMKLRLEENPPPAGPFNADVI